MANSLFFVFSYIYLALMSSFLIKTIGTINSPNSTKIVLQLIHRNSIVPASFPYRPHVAVSSSEAHHLANYLQSEHAAISAPLIREDDAITAPLIPEEQGRLFWVNVSIGEPPRPQLLAMDTGSALTWVGRIHSFYVPHNSSTCNVLSCYSTPRCVNYFSRSQCRKGSRCAYHQRYLDGTRSTGILALEKFTFLTSTGGISTIPNVLFGIETDGNSSWLKGIIGLGIDSSGLSIVSSVGNKFSYCIGNMSDPYYPHNRLILGDGAIFEGDSTSLDINWDGHYVVTLEEISVGDKQLDIDEDEFEYNVLIDSGTTYTTLPRNEYEQLKEAVMELLAGVLQQVLDPKEPDHLCYRGNLERDLKGFPTVTLHLAQDTDLSLDAEHMFQRYSDDVFCMAFGVSKGEVHIIGIIAQQYYNIGFDLNARTVSFQDIDCEVLED